VLYESKNVSIGKAAKEMGVAIETLRRWEAAGKIEFERTPRTSPIRPRPLHVKGVRPRALTSTRAPQCDARVSSHDQNIDLITQVALLESYCASNGWTDEALQDSGSGLNHYQRGLR
jgi:putative resolvase